MYIVTSFVFFMVGGLLPLLMQAELARPALQFLSPEQYNQLFTMHGTIMVLFYATPVVFGFANLRAAAADRRAGCGLPAVECVVVLAVCVAEPPVPLFEFGKCPPGDGVLVHRFPGAHAEDDPAWVEAAQGGEGLGDDRRVVPKGGSQDTGAENDVLSAGRWRRGTPVMPVRDRPGPARVWKWSLTHTLSTPDSPTWSSTRRSRGAHTFRVTGVAVTERASRTSALVAISASSPREAMEASWVAGSAALQASATMMVR